MWESLGSVPTPVAFPKGFQPTGLLDNFRTRKAATQRRRLWQQTFVKSLSNWRRRMGELWEALNAFYGEQWSEGVRNPKGWIIILGFWQFMKYMKPGTRDLFFWAVYRSKMIHRNISGNLEGQFTKTIVRLESKEDLNRYDHKRLWSQSHTVHGKCAVLSRWWVCLGACWDAFFCSGQKGRLDFQAPLFAFRLNKTWEGYGGRQQLYAAIGGQAILGDTCFFLKLTPALPSHVSQNGNAPSLNKNDLKSPGAMSFASENESFSKIISFKTAKMNRCCDPSQEMKGISS